MIDLVAFFFAVALILYCILGGADFGAGILELAGGKAFRQRHRSLINKAMGPVWEANHVWLILAVVILFMAFPPIFRQLSIAFHIPLTLLLFGITVRGCAFTFRHYDAVEDRSQTVYSFLFVVSSFLTPLFLGMIAGSMPLGFVKIDGATSWADAYLHPWLNWYSFTIGVFCICLFGYVAAVYLCGESRASNRRDFLKLAWIFGGFSVVAGFLVFLVSLGYEYDMISMFLSNRLAMACLVGASVLFFPLARTLNRGQVWLPRLLVSSQVGAVVIGWFAINFPVIIATNRGQLSVYNSAAPPSTLEQLLIALIVGGLLIFPALGYLIYVFKRNPN